MINLFFFTWILVNVGLYVAIVYAALKFYRRTDDVDSDMEEMDTEDTSGPAAAAVGDDAAVGTQPYKLRQLLTAADLRRPLFVACMLQVIQQFSGINAVSSVPLSLTFSAGV